MSRFFYRQGMHENVGCCTRRHWLGIPSKFQNGALPCESNKVSYEIIAWFMYVWRCISATSASGTSELGSVQVHCVAKGRQVPWESSRTGEYHRDELIPTVGFHPFISLDLLPLLILCFCFFVFGESTDKWVQVRTTSFLCALTLR